MKLRDIVVSCGAVIVVVCGLYFDNAYAVGGGIGILGSFALKNGVHYVKNREPVEEFKLLGS